MGIQIKKQLFTVDDYYKMAEVGILKQEDRVELIKGEILKMSPIKSLHASVVDTLSSESNYQLHGRAIVRTQNPIRINQYSEPEPDIVIAKFRKDKYRDQHPAPQDIYLVIEVADSTLAKDRTLKKQLYAESSIPEYWIVNLPKKQIEIYRQPNDKAYANEMVVPLGETAVCSTIPFELPIDTLF